MKTFRLAVLAFLTGWAVVALVLSQGQFLWQAFHHGGW